MLCVVAKIVQFNSDRLSPSCQALAKLNPIHHPSYHCYAISKAPNATNYLNFLTSFTYSLVNCPSHLFYTAVVVLLLPPTTASLSPIQPSNQSQMLVRTKPQSIQLILPAIHSSKQKKKSFLCFCDFYFQQIFIQFQFFCFVLIFKMTIVSLPIISTGFEIVL